MILEEILTFQALLDSSLLHLRSASDKFHKKPKIIKTSLSQYSNWNFKTHYKKTILSGQKIKNEGM